MAGLTQTSLKRLDGVHPDLVRVVKRAVEITTVAFQVTEGVRTPARQRALMKLGSSKTLRSRHLVAPNGYGHAVDLVAMIGGRVSWEEPLYHRIADAMKQAAGELKAPLEWGGDWRSFFDGPHFQLPWAAYPGVKPGEGAPAPEPPTDAELATLAPGSKGEAVAALQRDLNALGASLKEDGDFGPKTRAAVLRVSARLTARPTDIVTASLREKIAKAARKAAKQAT